MPGPINATGSHATAAPAPARARTDDRNVLERAASWTSDHLGTVATGMAWLALAAQVPMARRAPAAATKPIRTWLAGQVGRSSTGAAALATARAGQASVRRAASSVPGATAAARGARAGWAGLREARMRLGDTRIGRLGVRAQMPIYAASGVIGGAFLAQDARNWAKGEGSVKDTFLHALMVVPVASEFGARVARTRALATETHATERSVDHLAAARSSARAATTAAARAEHAPAELVRRIDRTQNELADAVAHAATGARDAGRHARLVGEGSGVPTEVDQTLRVGLVRDEVQGLTRTVAAVKDAARADQVLPPAVANSLQVSRSEAARAQAILEQGWRGAARSWGTARNAKALEDVSLKGLYTAFLANNADLVARSAMQGRDGDAQSAAVRFARIGALALLIRNEKSSAAL